MKRITYILCLFLLIVQKAIACPNCKDAYTPGSAGATVGESYSWSVLFMLIMPIATIALISMRIVYSAKKNRNTDL
jgi:hypothetical protein